MKEKMLDKLIAALVIADTIMFWIGILIIGICYVFSLK